MRNFKILALLAVSAMATIAFAGSASASVFEAGEIGKAISTTTLTQHVITITESKVECSTSKFEGTTEKNSSATLKVHPVYEGCKAFGFTSGVSVTTTGCDYAFNANKTSGMGNMEIVDHAGETCSGIVITADPTFTTCTAVLPKQTISGAAGYTNNSGEIAVALTASKIEVNVTASSGLCPLTKGLHSGENGGSYSGESEIGAEGTFLEWWEQNPVEPKMDVSLSPAGMTFTAPQKKTVKIEDKGAGGEDWLLRTPALLPSYKNWVETNLKNCQNQPVTGGMKFNCQFEVECKASEKETNVVVYWTMNGRLAETYFGPLKCP